MAGLLAVFAAFERGSLGERTCAGLAHSRLTGKSLGRPATAATHAAEIRRLYRAGAKAEIARRLRVGRASVRRMPGDSSPKKALPSLFTQVLLKLKRSIACYQNLELGIGPGLE
jgi:DNA invertase Pin-like site-specific DNA recombinase